MATIHPFRALRPVPEKAEAIASVPYDVINTEEARALARGKPDSFLHVIRPEIDLPVGTDEHDAAVYEKGAENLRRYARSSLSLQEDAPALYVYRLVMFGREQTGLFGCVSVAEYDDDTILKHENTRPVKEDDRTRHILTQRAHAEPVMLTYRDNDSINQLIEAVKERAPLYDFTAEDGVRHTIWKADIPQSHVEVTRVDEGDEQVLLDTDVTQALVELFKDVETLYVADGHHRCKAASRAAEALDATSSDGEAPEFAFFPAVLFPMSQMHIMPYNRIVKRLPIAPEDLLNELARVCHLETGVADPTPNLAGEVCLYMQHHWHRIELPHTRRATVADGLDVARLSEFILEPILDIEDPRTDPNIDFVGGIRGTGELEKRVDGDEAELAFSMYATSIEELVAVSDAGLLMPPKSTWFEPKLRSGLLVHLFD